MTSQAQPTSHLYIITGASRGLGHALALQLLGPPNTLLTLARHTSASLQEQAQQTDGPLTQWPVDLADARAASQELSAWLGKLDAASFATATLVNNAGVIPAITPLRQANAADIANALRVGLEAAMLLTASFLGATSAWPGQRRVLNISSGLGRRPMASQATYCAAKAGMDLFTRCVALEEAAVPNGARVCALAPGVIDTSMQARLRSADAQSFPDVAYFQGLHDSNSLADAAVVAERIAAFVAHPDFGQEVIARIDALPL